MLHWGSADILWDMVGPILGKQLFIEYMLLSNVER